MFGHKLSKLGGTAFRESSGVIPSRPEAGLRAAYRSVLVLLLAGLMLGGCSSENNRKSPVERLARGWEMYRMGEFSIATSIFQSVEKSEAPASENDLQAIYGEASCWSYRRDDHNTAKALELYRSLIARAPHHPLAAWCALDIVHAAHYGSAEQPLNNELLARDYQAVYRRYPETPAGEEAFLYASSLRLYNAGTAEAAEILAELVAYTQAHPASPYLSTFDNLMALACAKTGEEDRRLDYMITALQDRKTDSRVPFFELPTVYWNIAYTAEYEAGNFKVAREYYGRLMSEFPRDKRILAARRALDEMAQVEAAVREGRPLPRELIAEKQP